MRSVMAEVFQLFVEGKVDAAVDTTFPLHKASEALQYVKDGQVKGKVVLRRAWAEPHSAIYP